MTEYRVFVGLGSNLGERERFLQDAARRLGAIPGTSVVWFSSVFETDPYGKAEQPRFLNVAAEVTTSLDPPALLSALKGIETSLGRTKSERWGPREIDLDILLYDGLVYADEAVRVPHPELEHRRFVLVPLREIAPDLIHPVSGLTVEEMAAACRDQGRVVKTSFHIRP
jgi:2-amino-4-hydroxy-6-hydroxymethyldihydropteridine diphosphokinase